MFSRRARRRALVFVGVGTCCALAYGARQAWLAGFEEEEEDGQDDVLDGGEKAKKQENSRPFLEKAPADGVVDANVVRYDREKRTDTTEPEKQKDTTARVDSPGSRDQKTPPPLPVVTPVKSPINVPTEKAPMIRPAVPTSPTVTPLLLKPTEPKVATPPAVKSKTPPADEQTTPEDWESRVPSDWRSPQATVGEKTKTPSRVSPPPFGATWAASPVPTPRLRANGADRSETVGRKAPSEKVSTGTTEQEVRTQTPQTSQPVTATTPVIAVRAGGRGGGVDTTETAASGDTENDKAMLRAYDAMQRTFELERKGFDLTEVTKTKHYFHFETHPGVGVWPLPYNQCGLPKECARLVVLSLLDAPAVAAASAACAREVFKIFGDQKIPCFNVARTAYHVSVFFLSLPSDPMADPFTAESKEDVSGSNGSTGDSRKVAISVNNHSLKALGDKFRCDARREMETVEACISGAECGINPAVTLTVDRITMTTSGALVLLFRDCGGELRDIRESLKKAFPGAPSQQTKIAHCTLLRAFPETETQLTDSSSGRALADCKAACLRWTTRLRGTVVQIDRAWLVREERFSSIDGARHAFRIGG